VACICPSEKVGVKGKKGKKAHGGVETKQEVCETEVQRTVRRAAPARSMPSALPTQVTATVVAPASCQSAGALGCFLASPMPICVGVPIRSAAGLRRREGPEEGMTQVHVQTQ
jgi:hypothetical protein